MQRRRHPFASSWILLSLLVAAVTATAGLGGVRTKTACDASASRRTPPAARRRAARSTAPLTVSGSTCTFDFGTRNLTVSGTVAAQGKTLTLKAKSMKVTGSSTCAARAAP